MAEAEAGPDPTPEQLAAVRSSPLTLVASEEEQGAYEVKADVPIQTALVVAASWVAPAYLPIDFSLPVYFPRHSFGQCQGFVHSPSLNPLDSF